MHLSFGWSCTDHVADHTLITWLIVHWSRGWSCTDLEADHTLITCKKIKPVNPKGNQFWIFIGRTHAEAETPILWPFDVKSRFTEKDPDAVKNWGQEEKGETEDEMSGWHHWLNGYNFEQAKQDCEGQGSLVCCSLWGRRVRHDWVIEQQQSLSLYLPSLPCIFISSSYYSNIG